MTDIPEDIMREAARVHAEFADSRVTDNFTIIIARALLAAEKRGAERAATIIDKYAHDLAAQKRWVWRHSIEALRQGAAAIRKEG